MKIQCAWCYEDMGYKQPHEDESTTHGICLECAERMLGEPIKTMREFFTGRVNDDQKKNGKGYQRVAGDR